MPPSTRTLLASRSTIGDLPAGSFSAIPASALHLLDAVSLRVSLAAGVTVFEEGARAGRVYFVCSGRVKLFTASRDGRIFVFRFARAGDLLGLSAALDGAAFEATAETVEPTVLKSIAPEDFKRLLVTYAEVGQMAVQSLAREHRELFLETRSLALSRTVSARLARFLLDWPHTAVSGKLELRLTIALSHCEIAAMVGTTRETVTRVLKRFERKALIERRGASLAILDPVRLDLLAQ